MRGSMVRLRSIIFVCGQGLTLHTCVLFLFFFSLKVMSALNKQYALEHRFHFSCTLPTVSDRRCACAWADAIIDQGWTGEEARLQKLCDVLVANDLFEPPQLKYVDNLSECKGVEVFDSEELQPLQNMLRVIK